MGNKILNFLLTFVVLVVTALNANALTTESDIHTKLNNLNIIAQYDYISLINKSELIGYRLENFKFSTSQYQNTARLAVEKINNTINQIEIIHASSDFSDTDKQIQINNLLQDVDTILSDLDTETLAYLYALRSSMPTITYKKYIKKFLEIYNSKTNAQLSVN